MPVKDQGMHSTTISVAAFMYFTTFQMHWFALMKDNLDAFEVLFCPLGRMQRLTHTCTHRGMHKSDFSAQHAEQELLHLYLAAPSNPAIVWPPHEIRIPCLVWYIQTNQHPPAYTAPACLICLPDTYEIVFSNSPCTSPVSMCAHSGKCTH